MHEIELDPIDQVPIDPMAGILVQSRVVTIEVTGVIPSGDPTVMAAG